MFVLSREKQEAITMATMTKTGVTKTGVTKTGVTRSGGQMTKAQARAAVARDKSGSDKSGSDKSGSDKTMNAQAEQSAALGAAAAAVGRPRSTQVAERKALRAAEKAIAQANLAEANRRKVNDKVIAAANRAEAQRLKAEHKKVSAEKRAIQLALSQAEWAERDDAKTLRFLARQKAAEQREANKAEYAKVRASQPVGKTRLVSLSIEDLMALTETYVNRQLAEATAAAAAVKLAGQTPKATA